MIEALAPAELATHLRKERDAVDAALAEFADALAGDDVLDAALRYALAAGGKRLRPILCAAAYDAAGGNRSAGPELYRAVSAVEVMHTYSLVHDDLPCMDDDDLRRGRPTVHRVFGTAPSVAAGFALIPLACRLLEEASAAMGVAAAARARAIAELCRGAGAAGMVGGQVLDLEAEGLDIPVAALRHIHAMKTGALFRASARVGAALAGAPQPVCEALGEYGLRLGLAFQIADDVLDVTMDAAALGKTPGKDAGAGKATYAGLFGPAEARDAARREARGAIATLRDAGLHSPLLDALARFAVERDR